MKKALRVYVLATQLIMVLIICSVAGILYGRYKDPDGNLQIILAGVGVIIGLFIDIITVIQFLRNEAREEQMIKTEKEKKFGDDDETGA